MIFPPDHPISPIDGNALAAATLVEIEGAGLTAVLAASYDAPGDCLRLSWPGSEEVLDLPAKAESLTRLRDALPLYAASRARRHRIEPPAN